MKMGDITMKQSNMTLKIACEITAVISVIAVFAVGTWFNWQRSTIHNEMPTLRSETMAWTKYLAGIDIESPSDILAKEQSLLNKYLDDESEQEHRLSDEEIDAIVEQANVISPKEIKVLEPLTTNMQASFKSDKRVFIYHTHSREGWHGEEYASDKNANSKEINITLLGEKLGEELAARGIGSIVSTTDYATKAPGYEWAYSYKFSRKSVKEVLAANQNIEMVFDLHRDSQPRKYTTTTINGVDYAQVYFIIGKRNENWEKNEAFAEKLNKKIEELYPGLSRGIWGKNANSGNGEYNQSLHEKNVLIEVGGVDNTLEENYRTIKALAHVIALIAEEDEQ